MAYSGITLPAWLVTSGEYFGSLSLALICIGGSLTLKAINQTRSQALEASLWEMIGMPALGAILVLPLGFRGAELGILFLFLASPGAAISYVMAKAVGGNGQLAANIIDISAFGSMATGSLGIFLLTLAQLI